MPKRSSKKTTESEQTKLPAPPGTEQLTEAADLPVSEAPPEGKNPAAVALGRLGGKKGGPARAAKLTKEQRAAIARKAAQARWKKS